MNTNFQINDPSLESQWRAIILFGQNTATYKFAFAKALLKYIEEEKTSVSLAEIAIPFADSMVEHYAHSEIQGTTPTNTYLQICGQFNSGEISKDELYQLTEKHAFKYVVDAFHKVNGSDIPNKFYEKNYGAGKKEIVITDDLLKIKELYQYQNFEQEVEARWRLVETAWNLKINPNMLEVKYDESESMIFVQRDLMRRVKITSVRDALNGYQEGKCFYSYQDISINKNEVNTCAVDHFLPHINKEAHVKAGVNINGIWNLVLADKYINLDKRARIPEYRFLQRLIKRNEKYIKSNLPLAETIINQTGNTPKLREAFLNQQYLIAKEFSFPPWKPSIELPGTF